MISGVLALLRRFALPGLLILATLVAVVPAVSAAEAEVTSAKVEATEDGYRLNASFSFELNHGLVDAITKEIPLTFTTEVEVTRSRWYWFDEKTVRITQSVRIGYNPWTRQYTATTNNGLQQNFSTLDEALILVQRPRRILLADKNSLTSGAMYNVAVKLKLDLSYLPKTFLIAAINNSDWRVSSDWKRFTFRAE